MTGGSAAAPAADTIEEMLTVTITIKVERAPGFSALVTTVAPGQRDPVTIRFLVAKSAGFFTVQLPIEFL